jgi:general secretion pathway protein C
MILREKVVLRVEDRDEILAMQDATAKGSGPRYSKTTEATSKLPVSTYARKIPIRRDQVEDALENIGDIMQQATIRPHIEDGRPAGISITGIKPNAIFRRLRLRNGDVITGINGTAIESVEDALGVFEDIGSGSSVSLEIKRRGRQQTLNYEIQ